MAAIQTVQSIAYLILISVRAFNVPNPYFSNRRNFYDKKLQIQSS